jgi:RNA polymerase sigma-70 factor (ECF subfamily)
MTTGTPPPSTAEPLSADATVDLLDRIKGGDRLALEALLSRCLPALRRWAHGRLPAYARSMLDTNDLVQDAVIKAMRRLEVFESRHQGALLGYLRTSVMNQIFDLADQHARRGDPVELPEHLADEETSPLDRAIGTENLRRYEAALARLEAADREAIVARLEMQHTYEEVAVILNKPSAAAARMAVTRAMKRLADEIRRGQ